MNRLDFRGKTVRGETWSFKIWHSINLLPFWAFRLSPLRPVLFQVITLAFAFDNDENSEQRDVMVEHSFFNLI